MKISPLIQSFVLHFGEMGSRWGFNRTIGQLYALLLMTEKPLAAEDLAAALQISRGNVSMGLKELQSWRLIKVQHQPGDRKDYFCVDGSVWEMARRVVEERRKREVDPTLSLLRDILMRDAVTEEDQFAQHKIHEIHSLLELVSKWSKDLQGMQAENLATLMKLGAGVSKILDFKDKLLPNRQKDEDTG